MNLKNIALFQGMSESEIAMVKTCLREKSFDKGEMLHGEGDECERIFIVQKGRVKIYRMTSAGREQILEILEEGDTCACNPGSLDWLCATSAEAVTPCTVWFLSRRDYVQMVQNNSKISHALNKLFAKRLQCFSSLIEEVSLKDAKKRLIKFLLDMIPLRPPSGNGTSQVLQIPFTRQEIAQRIGTARETVARHLYQLKKSRLIDIRSHQIKILNKPGLEKLLH